MPTKCIELGRYFGAFAILKPYTHKYKGNILRGVDPERQAFSLILQSSAQSTSLVTPQMTQNAVMIPFDCCRDSCNALLGFIGGLNFLTGQTNPFGPAKNWAEGLNDDLWNDGGGSAKGVRSAGF